MANISDPVARQYANALYELATEKSCVQQVFDDLSALDQAYREDKVFRTFFTSPNVPEEAKLKSLEAALAGAHEMSRSFVGLLIRKGREALLDNVMDAFEKHRDEVEARVHVHVESAKALESDMRDSLQREIASATKKEVVIHENVDASLIGGLRVRIGDRMLDASLKSRLTKLARSISSAQGANLATAMESADELYSAAQQG